MTDMLLGVEGYEMLGGILLLEIKYFSVSWTWIQISRE
jgi:hypothetical protein